MANVFIFAIPSSVIFTEAGSNRVLKLSPDYTDACKYSLQMDGNVASFIYVRSFTLFITRSRIFFYKYRVRFKNESRTRCITVKRSGGGATEMDEADTCTARRSCGERIRTWIVILY